MVGEFRMVLRKVNGSLGFTLQSTDETVLKHTVKVYATIEYIEKDGAVLCTGGLSQFSEGRRCSTPLS